MLIRIDEAAGTVTVIRIHDRKEGYRRR